MNKLPSSTIQFEYPREVRWVDVDSSQFVHFSAYIRMMEETEYAFLRSRDLSVVLYDERGTLGFPRLSAQIQIHQPLKFGDQVIVKLELVDVDGKQVIYDFKIVTKDETLAVEGRFKAACCRFPDGKLPYAVLIPDAVIESLTKN